MCSLPDKRTPEEIETERRCILCTVPTLGSALVVFAVTFETGRWNLHEPAWLWAIVMCIGVLDPFYDKPYTYAAAITTALLAYTTDLFIYPIGIIVMTTFWVGFCMAAKMYAPPKNDEPGDTSNTKNTPVVRCTPQSAV